VRYFLAVDPALVLERLASAVLRLALLGLSLEPQVLVVAVVLSLEPLVLSPVVLSLAPLVRREPRLLVVAAVLILEQRRVLSLEPLVLSVFRGLLTWGASLELEPQMRGVDEP
jgi:hypothetical protein